MTFSKLKIALIGLGSIAQKAYLPLLCTHELVSPLFCTRNAKILKQLAAKYRVDACYQHVEELLKAKPDAAMVHSATPSHFTIVKQLLQAGIPTFVDKPLACSLPEVEVLLNLARQKKTLLYLGFNRRFLPLISRFKTESPTHILWEKNRVNLPGDPRIFIFQDFIHVLDSLRFLSGSNPENLEVSGWKNKQQLERVYVRWEHKNTRIEGKMNRVSGITEERMQYYSTGKKYELETLEHGWHYENENKTPMSYNPWASTLYKRGFEDMIADWLKCLQNPEDLSARLEDIFQTHALCERVLEKLT